MKLLKSSSKWLNNWEFVIGSFNSKMDYGLSVHMFNMNFKGHVRVRKLSSMERRKRKIGIMLTLSGLPDFVFHCSFVIALPSCFGERRSVQLWNHWGDWILSHNWFSQTHSCSGRSRLRAYLPETETKNQLQEGSEMILLYHQSLDKMQYLTWSHLAGYY